MFHLAITRLAQGTALLGGFVLIALVCMVCVSVLFREISTQAYNGDLGPLSVYFFHVFRPIKGDYELVEAGMAFAIFSFLPLTQLTQSHARVDIFTAGLGPKTNAALGAFWSVMTAAVILLITWRLFVGMQDKLRHGETTFLLQFPVWWAYAACVAAAVVACIVSLYCATLRLTGRRTG